MHRKISPTADSHFSSLQESTTLFFHHHLLKIKWKVQKILASRFFLLSYSKVPGDRGTNHRAFPPHVRDHGRRGDVPTSQRPQPRLQWPLPAVELRRRRAACGRVGGAPVERPGAARQVPRTAVCARALVLLHATRQEEPLVRVLPGHFLRQSSYSD